MIQTRRGNASSSPVTIEDLRSFVRSYDESERDHREKFMRASDVQLQTLKAQLTTADDARTDQLVEAIRATIERRTSLREDIHRAVLSGISANPNPAESEILKLLRKRATAPAGASERNL